MTTATAAEPTTVVVFFLGVLRQSAWACTVLIQLWRSQLVAGQGFIPAIPRLVPQRAGVINDSPTAGSLGDVNGLKDLKTG